MNIHRKNKYAIKIGYLNASKCGGGDTINPRVLLRTLSHLNPNTPYEYNYHVKDRQGLMDINQQEETDNLFPSCPPSPWDALRRCPYWPGLVVLGQCLSALVGVVGDLRGGPLEDLLELGLQALHDGLHRLRNLLQLGQGLDEDAHELGAVLLRVHVQVLTHVLLVPRWRNITIRSGVEKFSEWFIFNCGYWWWNNKYLKRAVMGAFVFASPLVFWGEGGE